jgi:hypothetical protein
MAASETECNRESILGQAEGRRTNYGLVCWFGLLGWVGLVPISLNDYDRLFPRTSSSRLASSVNLQAQLRYCQVP